jgi:hypothetical protein
MRQTGFQTRVFITANQLFAYASKSVFEAADKKQHKQKKFEPLLQIHKKKSCDGQFFAFQVELSERTRCHRTLDTARGTGDARSGFVQLCHATSCRSANIPKPARELETSAEVVRSSSWLPISTNKFGGYLKNLRVERKQCATSAPDHPLTRTMGPLCVGNATECKWSSI